MKQIVAGKYRLNLLLGSGGMAEVWSATNTFTEREVAIKFLSHRVSKTPEATTRFLKEAKVSARVNHPNIIDVIDVGQTEEGQLFIVMELLTGFSLETALRRQMPRMTMYELAIVMADVGEALAAAHKAGIVHRDLKPTNIFLHVAKVAGASASRPGRSTTKLLDFGVSKFLEDDGDHAITIAGTVLGSPLYMSPEQARGEANIDGRTDIFAFGSILFEALSGRRAYDARNFNALIVKIATSTPKSIDEHAPHVPESIRRVVRACMEPNLDRRVRDFADVIAMLRHAMPELEAMSARLSTQLVPSAVVDPDATNALPVVRASDHPPPSPLPVNTPGTPYATTASPSPNKSPAWLVTLGTAVVVGGLGVGAVLAMRPSRTVYVSSTSARVVPTSVSTPLVASSSKASIKTDAPETNVASLPTASIAASAASAASSPKVMSIDELPSVKPTAPRAGVPHTGCDGGASCRD
jgi:eukaryotic-like serine/threonine-protein kinase